MGMGVGFYRGVLQAGMLSHLVNKYPRHASVRQFDAVLGHLNDESVVEQAFDEFKIAGGQIRYLSKLWRHRCYEFS